MSTQQKVALITGGTSGLGFATAKKFKSNGYFIVMVDLYSEDAPPKIEALGGSQHACFYQCDVTDSSRVQEVVDDVIKKFKEIHVLLNSAGMGTLGSILTKKGQINIEGKEALVHHDHYKAFERILAVNV